MTNISSIASLEHHALRGRSEGARSGPSSRGVPDRLAKGLGWFSLGLGLTELAPDASPGRSGWRARKPWCASMVRGEIGSGILSLSVDREISASGAGSPVTASISRR